MTDALTLLQTRRSIPAAFLGPPGPSPDQLRQLLTIAARVPDHGKLAPWRFIVLEGEARAAAGALLEAQRLRKEPGLPENERSVERGRFTRAPLVVGVVSRVTPGHPKATEREQLLSAGASAMSLVLAAHAMGFAANWLTERPAADAEARTILGLTESERIAAFVYIGTPTVPPQERPRPDVSALTTFWRPPGA